MPDRTTVRREAAKPLTARQTSTSPGTSVVQAPERQRHCERSPDKESSVPSRLLSLREAAHYLGLSYWSVRGWVESGRLLAVRLGPKLIRVERADLDRMIADRKDSALQA